MDNPVQQQYIIYKEWLDRLNFSQDEIKYFQNSLAYLSAKKPPYQKQLDKFRQDFFKQLQEIDKLRYDIHLNQQMLIQLEKPPENKKQLASIERFFRQYDKIKKSFKGYESTILYQNSHKSKDQKRPHNM